jgi:hypothetical protein
MNRKTIYCSCEATEHFLSFIIEDDEMYIHFFLSEEIWYKRLWLGIKYIFGYKCKYGHFGEIVLVDKQAQQLKEIAEEFLNK